MTSSRRPTRRLLPSPALVVATIALLLAVGGSAYAVAVAPPNSVVSSSIADGQVRSRDVLNGTLKDKDVGEGALTGRVLAEGAVGGPSLAPVQVVTAVSAQTTDADGTNNGGGFNVVKVTASCSAGTTLLAGGARWVQPSSAGTSDGAVHLQEQYASNNGTAWTVEGIVDFGAQGNIRLQAEAYCLREGPIQN